MMSGSSVSSKVISILDDLVAAQTVEAVWAVHTNAMAEFGFDRLFYGFTRSHTEFGLGHHDDILVLSNHTDEYLEGYFKDDLYLDAPMLTWARQNVGAMSWSWIIENKSALTSKQKKVLAFNLSHGVTAGYTISFRDAVTRNKGAIALTAGPGISQCDVETIWARSGREINILNQFVHLRIASLPWPSVRRRLSARQREVLEWVGDGKTIADIATIMGLTAATVEKHLRKARDALNVETTAQAVMKASIHKQIFTMDADFPTISQR